MKLYNIFEDIILEEQKKLLTEGVLEDIKKAMEGSYNVWLKYRTKDGKVTDRYIEINKLGTSIANNAVIRLYQKGGQTTAQTGLVRSALDAVGNDLDGRLWTQLLEIARNVCNGTVVDEGPRTFNLVLQGIDQQEHEGGGGPH